jgi:3-oxoacyl-[acyl-carrier protein] reductase
VIAARRGAVVTGDMGGGVAAAIARDGFTVYAADLRPLPEAEGIVPVVLDVTDRAAVFDLAERAARESDLRVWINAAGVFEPARVIEADEAAWECILAINLSGTFHGCAAALRVMAASGRGGRIVNVGSISGQLGGVGVHPAYGASKAGVHALTKTYALEGAKHGIYCNAVAPGVLEGRMTAGFPPEALAKIVRGNPQRRLGRMDEIVHAILYLADERASFTNGVILPLNGGELMVG